METCMVHNGGEIGITLSVESYSSDIRNIAQQFRSCMQEINVSSVRGRDVHAEATMVSFINMYSEKINVLRKKCS